MTSPRPWRMEDLLDGRGAIGRAEAAARLRGDGSARAALDDLRAAVAELNRAALDEPVGEAEE